MFLKGKVAKALLLVALTICLPITPHNEIEEIQRAMNGQRIEVVIPVERNGTDDDRRKKFALLGREPKRFNENGVLCNEKCAGGRWERTS
jgi:hypothetical protein